MTVHVPPGYDPQHPAPLLIALHHYGGSGAEQEAYFKLGTLAEQGGYLYALPDGTRNKSDIRFWNATDACCDFDRSGVDDVGYLAGVIKEIQASFAVDPKRIDLIGHSNGGFMVYAVACSHADEVAAIVSLAGATFGTPTKCAPSVPVAALQIHGTADDQIAFDGGAVRPGQSPGNESEYDDGGVPRRRKHGRRMGDVRRLHGQEGPRSAARHRCQAPRRRFARRDLGHALDGLSTWRSCRAVDDGRRWAHPEPVRFIPRGRDGLLRGPPQAVAAACTLST